LIKAVQNGTLSAQDALKLVPEKSQGTFAQQLGTIQPAAQKQNNWVYNSDTELYERTNPNT
jgi:hypothetical protein